MGREQDLTAWRLFVTIAEVGSVNDACDRLILDPSTASRILKALERDLGVKLFNRMTRPVSLTAIGKVVLEDARLLLQQQERLLGNFRDDLHTMKGLIRVSTYSGGAEKEVVPLLMKFQAMYPDVDFDLTELTVPPSEGFTTSEGKPVDVIMCYHFGDIPGALSFHTGDMPFIACASPQYIRNYGAPVEPEECKNHVGILLGSTSRWPAKALYKGTSSKKIQWKRTLAFHSFGAAKNALLLGAGIVVDMPFFHARQELSEGALIPILHGWNYPTMQCYIYVQESTLAYQRVKVFVDWMIEQQTRHLSDMYKEYLRIRDRLTKCIGDA